MAEQYVNRFALVMGHGGLGGKGFEFHARADDLEEMAKKLLENVELYRKGETRWHKFAADQGLALRPDEPVCLFSEYITLSRERTDRTTFSFYAVDSIDSHHTIVAPRTTAASLATNLAKLLWFVVLPFVGAIASVLSFARAF